MKSSKVSTDNNNHNRNKQAAENDLPSRQRNDGLETCRENFIEFNGNKTKERKKKTETKEKKQNKKKNKAKRIDNETEI